MGGCASTHIQNPLTLTGKPQNKSREVLILLAGNKTKRTNLSPAPEIFPPATRIPEVVKVICEDGRVEKFNPPITAREAACVVAPAPRNEEKVGGYLCSWESMYVDTCVPEIAVDEELKSGQVYFVRGRSKCNLPLSLHEMCALAIKASSGLSLEDFHSSFRR